MNESSVVKISAFPIYRFFRNGLPAMTGASAAGAFVLCVSAFIVFSPEFSFRKEEGPAAKIPEISLTKTPTEIGTLRDSEPLFLPTHWNFGGAGVPVEQYLRETSFLPFGGIFFLEMDSASPVVFLKNAQTLPSVEDALGTDAWKIARGFGAGTVKFSVEKPAGTHVRIVNESSGEEIFSGTLDDIPDGGDSETLLRPSEFICGIVSGYGAPTVIAVRSCGNASRDSRVAEKLAGFLHSLFPARGLYRIFVD